MINANRVDIIKHIEMAHPINVMFGVKKLNSRQQKILHMLPGYGSRATFRKREVSMLDLSTLTAATGDEFAMFTRRSERLIVRGNAVQIPLRGRELENLFKTGYRFSGHTHPGISESHLLVSDGDLVALDIFRQERSVVYNAAGRYKIYERVE